MYRYIEPFVVKPIATSHTEDEITSYYDDQGELIATVYCSDETFYSASFYGTSSHETPITKEEAETIVQKVLSIFQLQQLHVQSIELVDNEFSVRLIMLEPQFKIPIQNSGMHITISETGFVEEIVLHDNDFTITYPKQFISKEQASAILKQQPLLKLGIAPELDWQYVYMQNYDLYGVDPDGTIRLWSEDETMQDASFEALPKVDDIDNFEAFLQGGRVEPIQTEHTDEEKHWIIPSIEHISLQENHFSRACKVVKHLVGNEYEHYFVEQYPTLKALLALEDGTHVTYRFVYMYNDISFDFQAISISVDTETNQILSVSYPLIPFEKFSTLPLPTITLHEANAIAQQLVEAELTLESDITDRKKLSFVYLIDYPSSPTQGHIQYIDGFIGDIHWVETGW